MNKTPYRLLLSALIAIMHAEMTHAAVTVSADIEQATSQHPGRLQIVMNNDGAAPETVVLAGQSPHLQQLPALAHLSTTILSILVMLSGLQIAGRQKQIGQ